MKEMAEQVGDRKIEKWIHFYERYPYPVVARCLAVLLHRNAHAKVVDLITERLKKRHPFILIDLLAKKRMKISGNF